MLWLGIDPGVSGGFAVYDDELAAVVKAAPFDRLTAADVLREFTCFAAGIGYSSRGRAAVLEKVFGASPQMGKHAIAVFADQHGWCRGVLDALSVLQQLPWLHVLPAEWQRVLRIPPTRGKIGVGHAERKKLLRQFCEQILPASHPTAKTADAILIARAAPALFGGRATPAGPKRTTP